MAYIPSEFEIKDQKEILEIVKAYPMAVVVSSGDPFPVVSHLPVLLLESKEMGKFPEIFLHFALGNPHWEKLQQTPQCTLVFKGSEAYISPSWYSKPNVPTWNYEAVHLYGKMKMLNWDENKKLMSEMVKHFERIYADSPMLMEHLDKEYVDINLRGIKSFIFKMEKIEGIKKFSQNKSNEYLKNVWHNLEKSDSGKILSEKMKASRKK